MLAEAGKKVIMNPGPRRAESPLSEQEATDPKAAWKDTLHFANALEQKNMNFWRHFLQKCPKSVILSIKFVKFKYLKYFTKI